MRINSHPKSKKTKNHPNLQNHLLKPIDTENNDENLCHIAPTTANGYKITEIKIKTKTPAKPIGMYKIAIMKPFNFDDQQRMIKGQSRRDTIFIGIAPETKLEKYFVCPIECSKSITSLKYKD